MKDFQRPEVWTNMEIKEWVSLTKNHPHCVKASPWRRKRANVRNKTPEGTKCWFFRKEGIFRSTQCSKQSHQQRRTLQVNSVQQTKSPTKKKSSGQLSAANKVTNKEKLFRSTQCSKQSHQQRRNLQVNSVQQTKSPTQKKSSGQLSAANKVTNKEEIFRSTQCSKQSHQRALSAVLH